MRRLEVLQKIIPQIHEKRMDFKELGLFQGRLQLGFELAWALLPI